MFHSHRLDLRCCIISDGVGSGWSNVGFQGNRVHDKNVSMRQKMSRLRQFRQFNAAMDGAGRGLAGENGGADHLEVIGRTNGKIVFTGL